MKIESLSARSGRQEGFSLIEVMLALVLVASAIVTIMALVPVGLRSSRDASNHIVLGHILEDAHERIEGQKLEDGVIAITPFYYDSDGIFVAPLESEMVNSKDVGNQIKLEDQEEDEKAKAESAEIKNLGQQRRVYRVDVRIATPASDSISKNAPDLKAVILDIGWPVDPVTGELPVNLYKGNKKSVSYYVNALTGPGWSEADPEFKPLVEF